MGPQNHDCLDRPFTPEEISTITEVPPEDSKTKEIKLTVPIKGKHWCWLCKSHGEEMCPRKDEIGTKYGRQRLKELLQEMVKTEERVDQGEERMVKYQKKIKKHGFWGLNHLLVQRESLWDPKSYNHQRERNPISNYLRWGVGPNGQLNQQPVPHQKIQVVQGDNLQENPHNIGHSMLRGGGNKNGQGEEQPPFRSPPRENGGNGGNGNGGGDGDDDDDDEEDEDDEDTETVTENENGEDPNAPGGGGAPGKPGGGSGGGDGPPPNPGIGNVGPRGRRGHRDQRGPRGWTGPQDVQGPQGP